MSTTPLEDVENNLKFQEVIISSFSEVEHEQRLSLVVYLFRVLASLMKKGTSHGNEINNDACVVFRFESRREIFSK